jgi:hypothetical protein
MELERRRLEVHDIALVHADLTPKEVCVRNELWPGEDVVVEVTDADYHRRSTGTGRDGQPYAQQTG